MLNCSSTILCAICRRGATGRFSLVRKASDSSRAWRSENCVAENPDACPVVKPTVPSRPADDYIQYSETNLLQDKPVAPCILESGDSGKSVKEESTQSKQIPNGWILAKKQGTVFSEYLALGKIRLTSLVAISTMGGFAMAPVTFDFSLFCLSSTGVLFTSMCANSINQFLEAPYDAQMSRTQNRPLVKRSVTPGRALVFSVISGIAGIGTLYHFCNPLTAALGAFNIFLYAGCYTPMKRMNIGNTWLGSIVGAIPPLMGWTAATGSFCPVGVIMPLVLYSWQFAHFNSLSWNLRADYSRAGYQMMSVTDPALSKRVALRHCALLFPICWAAPITGLTTYQFAFDSTILNGIFTYFGWRFYRDGDSQSARDLFRFSLFYLPLVIGLMLSSKITAPS